MSITIRVIGEPAPKGSGRAMVRGGRPVFVASGSNVNRIKLHQWSSAVARACIAAKVTKIADRPVDIEATFYVRRPLTHYTKRGTLKANAPRYCRTKPDADKLLRSTFDALTDIGAWTDDSQVAHLKASKLYTPEGEEPGALITIAPLESD